MKKFIVAIIMVIIMASLLLFSAPINADEAIGTTGGYGYSYGYESD